jgi:hypothetical protein
LKVDGDKVLWDRDPIIWLQKNLSDVMKSYRLAIEMAQWDPQKVGKNINTYDFAEAVIKAQIGKKGGA